MSKTDTWMPFYIADYMADTMRLTTVQHGAYVLLMMEYWRKGPLPDDDQELAAITKADRKQWAKEIGPAVRRFFTKHEDGLLHQKRIDIERQRAVELSAKRRAAGQQRGNKKDAPDQQDVIKPEAIAEQLLTNSSGLADDLLPSLSRDLPPLTSKEDSVLRTGAVAPLPDVRDEFWSGGLETVSRLTGKTPKSLRSLFGKWARDAKNDYAMLNSIIADCVETRPGMPIDWIAAGITARMKPPDRLAWLDQPHRSASPEFDLEATADDLGTYHPN